MGPQTEHAAVGGSSPTDDTNPAITAGGLFSTRQLLLLKTIQAEREGSRISTLVCTQPRQFPQG